MCLIVHRPIGAVIPEDLLRRGIHDNSHGWGIMALSRRGKIRIDRGLESHKFWNAFDTYPADTPLAIHFRLATHGEKTVRNCHPFILNGGKYAMMHNGVLDVSTASDTSRSDTYHFGEHVLGPILSAHPSLFGDVALGETLEGLIGNGNKLVIMRAGDGATWILNPHSGRNHEGMWLSNAYSLAPRFPVANVANPQLVTFKTRDDISTSPARFPLDAEFLDDDAATAFDRLAALREARYDDDYAYGAGRFDPETSDTLSGDMPVTLDEFAGMTTDEIAEFTEYDPRAVADMIRDHLRWNGYSSR